MTFLLPLLSYLIGAIPFGLLIGRLAGIDVRHQGSRNIGATNVNRILGKKLGLLTLLLDIGKGFLPIFAASIFLPDGDIYIALCGLAAILGHMFPLYLGFKGGKGVATTLGVFLFLEPWSILISLVVFIAAVAVSGFVSVGSLAASALIPFWLYLFGASQPVLIVAALAAILICFQHRANISRLVKGEEKSWKKKKLP